MYPMPSRWKNANASSPTAMTISSVPIDLGQIPRNRKNRPRHSSIRPLVFSGNLVYQLNIKNSLL